MNSFIHTIWGIHDNRNHLWARLSKVKQDIRLFTLNPYSPKTLVYCFGTDNEKWCQDQGLKTVLVDPRPFIYDMEKHQYRHKMEVWRIATSEFDAVTFLDWDTIAIKPIPGNYWEQMALGNRIQCVILQYRQQRVNRKGDTRKVCSASFLYLRGSHIMPEMIRTWEEMGSPLKEEYGLTKYIDDLNGGWKGLEGFKKHDPIYYTLTPLYDKDKTRQCFAHFNARGVTRILGDGKDILDRIDRITL